MKLPLFMLAVSGITTLVFTASSVQAQTSAYTITNKTGSILGNPPFTLGFEFTANSAIKVTSLGVFDDSQDGLADSHAVGLYNSSGLLLASTTIASGTTDPLTNQFRYLSITPVTLTATQNYFVGAVYTTGSDKVIFPGTATGFAANASITFVQSTFENGSTLSFQQGTSGTDPSYFGPNFLFTSTPEPGAYALLISLGLTGAAFLRRRRAR